MSTVSSTPSPQAVIVHPDDGDIRIVLGDHQRTVLSGAQTANACVIVEQNNPAGVGVPPHYHTREDEIFHVLEGTVEFTANGEVVHVGPGTTVHLPRHAVHSFRYVTPGRMRVTCIPAGIEHMFEELAQLSPDAPITDALAICERFGVFFV